MPLSDSSHYHAFGEEGEGRPSRNAPVNGACRCAAHIAPPLKATRARPACTLECYLCSRTRELLARRDRRS